MTDYDVKDLTDLKFATRKTRRKFSEWEGNGD